MDNDCKDNLALLSDILQVANFIMNIQQSTNDNIMAELEKQDNKFFGEILQRLDRIESKIDSIERIKNG